MNDTSGTLANTEDHSEFREVGNRMLGVRDEGVTATLSARDGILLRWRSGLRAVKGCRGKPSGE